MAENVKCNSRRVEGVIRGTNFTVTGIGDSAKGLVQQFQLQFQRRLSRVYDLASPGFYYIEGPAEGQISFTKVVGPSGAPKLDCTCTPTNITLDAGQTLCYVDPSVADSGFDATYTLKNAMPFGLNGQGNANNFLIIFGISYLFNDIE